MKYTTKIPEEIFLDLTKNRTVAATTNGAYILSQSDVGTTYVYEDLRGEAVFYLVTEIEDVC